jgi:hypothetical protein
MFFFGWGTKQKSWDLGNGYTLLCVYRYFHIWIVIRFITRKNWYIQGDRRSEDRELTYEQVKQLIPSGAPRISAYN